jgi:DNA-binding response OmpR family regulator
MTSVPESTRTEAEDAVNSPFSALVVDDDPAIRDQLVAALERESFATKFASNGTMAENLCQIYRPDVVITDLKMPRMHGHELISKLLATPAPPIIVAMTGVQEPKLVRDLYLRGVDDVIFKPFMPELIAAKLYALVLRRRGG